MLFRFERTELIRHPPNEVFVSPKSNMTSFFIDVDWDHYCKKFPSSLLHNNKKFPVLEFASLFFRAFKKEAVSFFPSHGASFFIYYEARASQH